MKKTIYFMGLLIMAGAMIMISCDKDDDTIIPLDLTPIASFLGGGEYISDDATLSVNETFQVGIAAIENLISGKKLESFVVIRTFNNVSTTVLDSSFSSAEFYWESAFNANTDTDGGEERWSFTVTDKDGEATELSFIITTEAGGFAVLSYSDLDMGSYDDSHFGSFMATITANVLKKAEAATVQALVDIAFYYGTNNGFNNWSGCFLRISFVRNLGLQFFCRFR